jgi:Holliday junction DNA helicase RuvA
MIGYLRGKLIDLSTETALLDVAGVGYEVLASTSTLSDISPFLHKEITLWIYTHVREDTLQLFAFHSKNEKALFLSLLKVNGVGPKMALSILSGAGVQHVQALIENGDAKGLTQLPKVGKKIAEQIILTLRGKLVSLDPQSKNYRSERQNEILSALTNLGYKPTLVEEFIDSLPAETELEDGIRKGLQILSGSVEGRAGGRA